MPGGQRHHRRLQPRPKRRRGHELGQPSAGPCAAVPAAQLVRAMFAHDHADRRQLRHLVATEPPGRPALRVIEPTTAASARIRKVIDDLIHLILGPQLATRTAMPWLATSLAPLGLPAHQLLGLRTRLRTPLRPRLRRILRRRLRARARILPRLLLEPLQSILVLSDPVGEIENEPDTSLTPRVIDRLRLRAVHTRKIRCTKQESLPQAPTTERLHEPPHMQANHDRQVGRKTGLKPRAYLSDSPSKSDSQPVTLSGGSSYPADLFKARHGS